MSVKDFTKNTYHPKVDYLADLDRYIFSVTDGRGGPPICFTTADVPMIYGGYGFSLEDLRKYFQKMADMLNMDDLDKYSK